MWFSLIAFDGLFFWILFSAFCLLEFIAAGIERLWLSITAFISFVLVIVLFSNFNTWTFISDSWIKVLEYIGIYLAIGIFWSFIKWMQLCRKRAKVYGNCLKDWSDEKCVNIKSINDIDLKSRRPFLKELTAYFELASEKYDWNESFYCSSMIDERIKKDCTPEEIGNYNKYTLQIQKDLMRKILSSPFKHKEKITVWMSGWPFSMLSSFLFDFLYDLFNHIRKILNGFYVWLSKITFGKYRNDFNNISVKDDE